MAERYYTQLVCNDDQNILAEADFLFGTASRAPNMQTPLRARRQQIAEEATDPRRHHYRVQPFAGSARVCAVHKWLTRMNDELDQLLLIRTHLSNLVDAPNRTAGTIADSARQTAKRLLRGVAGGEDSADERHKLDGWLAAEKHRAEAKHEALTKLETSITEKKMHVESGASLTRCVPARAPRLARCCQGFREIESHIISAHWLAGRAVHRILNS
jgi:hypothetical protein